MDDESALLVSYCLTHPLRGRGIVDECRTETVDGIARYQTAYKQWGEPGYATRATNCCGYLEGALFCLLFPSVLTSYSVIMNVVCTVLIVVVLFLQLVTF